jgi:hypothetical protein
MTDDSATRPTCDDPAELMPTATDSSWWRVTCGCGELLTTNSTYDDAVLALDRHRPKA